jgi:ferredoxin
VHPYEEVAHYIRESTAIVVTDCACRKHHALLGNDDPATMESQCGHRIADTCIQLFYSNDVVNEFNSMGGRQISKVEAMNILEACEQEGLVHTSFNAKERIEFICNCCPCCCGILGTVTRVPQQVGAFVKSNFLPFVGPECKKCGQCAKACPMHAIEHSSGSMPSIATARCIGCGACSSTCKTGAMRLVKKTEREPAVDTIDAHLRFATSKLVN